MKKIIFSIFLVSLIVTIGIPFVAEATSHDEGLVICGKDTNENNIVEGDEQCNFRHVIYGIRVIITYLIMIAGSLAAISFAFAGYLYMTAGGDEHKVHEAHEIFWKVTVGFVIILSAWLLVKTVEQTLIASDSGIKSLLTQ